ncbi:hypothetical protein EJ07DRAFT_162083 [Lizonia empirigonia]|nr:hypothetical protein EJ07DRAFT_162083 [Lizonia empirigonia]
MTPTSTSPFPFLALPLELREHIYSLYFRPADRLRKSATLESRGFYGGVYGFEFGLYGTSRLVYREARRVWRREVRMVKVATPWPGAVNHISSEGLVPIVCTDLRADLVNDHHALIQISAPFHQAAPEHTVVLLLDDLPLFTQTWYYSALSHPMLNDRLSTAFVLRDPDMDDLDSGDEKDVPLALQRKLLLPFSQVKGLYSMDIEGFNKTVAHELRTAMAIPPPTLQHSCESATALLQAGDALLAQGAASAALASYKQAFHAIHILVHGHTRRVLADTFFHGTIRAGRYAGHTGMTVRVILRLQLVARTVAAYLAQRAFADAAFWGMRSVRIMAEAMDSEFEDFLADLVGGDDVGLIFVRTAIAVWCLRAEPGHWRDALQEYKGEERASPERLVGAGLKHFKHSREPARREMERWGLPAELLALLGDAHG